MQKVVEIRLEIIMPVFFAILIFYCYCSYIFLLLFSNYAYKNLNSQTLTILKSTYYCTAT